MLDTCWVFLFVQISLIWQLDLINKKEINVFDLIANKSFGFNVKQMNSGNNSFAQINISRNIDANYNCLFLIKKINSDRFLIEFNNTDLSTLIKNPEPINLENLKDNISSWVNMVKKEIEIEIDELDFNLSKLTYYSDTFGSLVRNAIKIIKDIDEDCGGMILRKAIEELFIDYFKRKIPALTSDLDEKYSIGPKINTFYDYQLNVKSKYSDYSDELNEIKPFISAISEVKDLGNDFAHYERKLEKYNVHDLMEYIKHIISFLIDDIDMEMQKKIKEFKRKSR